MEIMAHYFTDAEGNLIKIAGKGISNLDCVRTEVIYDKNDTNKNWGFASGILGSKSVSGKNFSKYEKLIIHCQFANAVTGTGILDLTYAIPSTSTYRTNLAFGSEGTLDVYMCRVSVNSAKTTITNELMGYTSGTSWANRDNAGNYHIYKIEGVLKEPAMIYTGNELYDGDGVKIENGVVKTSDVIYDMSGGSSLDWGYSSGIQNNVTVSGKDFSKYRKLKCYARIAGGINGIFEIDLLKTNGDGDLYRGSNIVWFSWEGSSTYSYVFICAGRVNTAKTTFMAEVFIKYLSTGNTVSNSGYYVYKIEGVY